MPSNIVISLPIKPQTKTSMGMTTGLQVGRAVADYLRCKYIMSINLMNGFEELEDAEKVFLLETAYMGIEPDIVWQDKQHKEALVSNIIKMINNGDVYPQKKHIMRCQCGRVCVERKYANNYGKLFSIKKGKTICNFCETVCEDVLEEVLVLKVPEQLNEISVFPEYLNKEVANILNRYKGKEIVISKPRETDCLLEINNKCYNLDVEFVWSQIFSCFEEKNMYLIASNHQIYVAAIIGIMSQLSSDKNIIFILTPYMKRESLFKIDKQNIRRKWLNKLFVLESLKWKKKDCNWDRSTYEKLSKLLDEDLENVYYKIIEDNTNCLGDVLTYSFQTKNILNRLGRI